MTKASDNEYPSVLFAEQGSNPSTPASGFWRAYFKSTGLFVIDDAGTVTGPFTTGGGSAVANVGRATYTGGDKTTTSTTFADVDASLSVTLTTGARRCLVGVVAVGKNSTSQQTIVDIDLDGSRLGGTFGLAFCSSLNSPLGFTYMTAALSAASHTFKLQWRVDGGTGTLYGNTTTAPIVLWVEELQA